MKIGGLQKVSLIDYPGFICATVFLQGCNFKCSYCHNPELVEPRLFQPCIGEKDVLEYLHNRKGKIDAVTISGGEPTIQHELIFFIRKIKKMGFAVKLDTNGSLPQVIDTLLKDNLLDYIAMDIKGPLEKYSDIACVSVDVAKIIESIQIVLKAEIPHEFRTTIVPSLLSEQDILKTAALISGARRYALQKFIPVKTLSEKFHDEKSISDKELMIMGKHLEKEILSVIVR